MHVMSNGIVRSLGSSRFLDWVALEAIRTALGGWGGAHGVGQKKPYSFGQRSGYVHGLLLFKNVSDGIVWAFIGVYGSLSKDGKSLIWEELGAIRGLWEAPWCVGGDFNVTCFPSKWSTMGRLNSSMRRFLEVIDDLELVDLPMSGGNFTWGGGMSNQTMAPLDRFPVSLDWMDHLGNVTQRKLAYL